MTRLRRRIACSIVTALTLAASQAAAQIEPQPRVLPAAPQPQQSAKVPERSDSPDPMSCRALRITAPARAPLEPMTSAQKAKLAACDLVHPLTYVVAAADSGISVAADPHSPYGAGLGGFAKRFGVDMTDEVSDDFFGTWLYPTIFHQNPHYHILGAGHSKTERVGYAMTRIFITEDDRGRNTWNAGELLGSVTTNVLANTYHQHQSQGTGNTTLRIGLGLASDAGFNIWKEYEPEMTRKLRLRANALHRIIQHIRVR